jgi:hypothetical protein
MLLFYKAFFLDDHLERKMWDHPASGGGEARAARFPSLGIFPAFSLFRVQKLTRMGSYTLFEGL